MRSRALYTCPFWSSLGTNLTVKYQKEPIFLQSHFPSCHLDQTVVGRNIRFLQISAQQLFELLKSVFIKLNMPVNGNTPMFFWTTFACFRVVFLPLHHHV